MTIHLSLYAIPGVNILVHLNGYVKTPQEGFIGVLTPGTKIAITLEVVNSDRAHSCYTLKSVNSQMVHEPKAPTKPGIYVKNLTVVKKESPDGTKTTQVAGWPCNMFCLDIHGKTYNIGIVCQNGRYFFVIEEWVPSIEVNELIPIGMILSVSLLRGTATIHTGDAIFNARAHWTNWPFRPEKGLRLLHRGEVILFREDNLLSLDSESSYRYEVIDCVLA